MKLASLCGLAFLGYSVSTSDQSNQAYTIQQAQQCFHSKALHACQNIINECLTKQQCERQLHFFHECNFEKEYPNQVFNGNCFKNWKNTAIASKQVISCFDNQCNLAGYNSQVSLGILYSCSTEALFNHHTECDQQCQQKLSKLVSEKVPFHTIKQIYQLSPQMKDDLNNEGALKIIEVIKKQCVDENGQIRIRHEKELLSKKKNRQRMMDRVNKRTKQDPFLDQEVKVSPNIEPSNQL